MAVPSDAADRARGAFGLRRDPSVPLTQATVENEIMRLSDKLEDATDELAGRAREAAETEANHKSIRAQRYLQAEGTEGKRTAAAEVACHDLYMKRKIAEAMYESTKQQCRSIEAQLDALRTISANIRAQT